MPPSAKEKAASAMAECDLQSEQLAGQLEFEVIVTDASLKQRQIVWLVQHCHVDIHMARAIAALVFREVS
jgi:hypothetical protein